MKLGIEIEILWWDNDLIKLRIRGSNGRFRGEADIYAAHGDLPELARLLRGFPTHQSDSRRFDFGTFDPSLAGGGVQLRFFCLDAAGHAGVALKFHSGPRHLGSQGFGSPSSQGF